MRIFMVNSVCGSGSTGRIVTDLCDILMKEGHEVKIAFGTGSISGIDSKYVVKINDKKGYYIHNAISRITDRAGFYSINATKKLINEIEKFKPDLIHLHNIHGYYINVKVLFKYLEKRNIPVVWTLHDCWALTGHCAHFSYIHCQKWKDKCYHCSQKRAYPKSYFWDNSEKNYLEKKRLFTSVRNMTIVTPSKWLADITRESFLSKYPVRVIQNGIDLEVFKKRQGKFKTTNNIENKIMILAVANVWIDKKGYFDILELSKRLEADRYQIVMVGLSKEQSISVPNTIIPIQRTESREELVEIYSEADIFINPSYEETMGLVTVEALACETPCVVYDRTAVPEVIDEECGIIVKAGDIDALYNAIINFDYKKISGCRKNAEKYDKKKKYQEYLELYLDLYKLRG